MAPIVKEAGKTLWIVVDGGYVKAPFLKRALRAGATVTEKHGGLRLAPPLPHQANSPSFAENGHQVDTNSRL